MSVVLADGNVLVALTVPSHVHHQAASKWFADGGVELATCPITEGTLLRFLLREHVDIAAAVGVLDAMRAQPWHRFWEDVLPYGRAMLGGVIGHRQVTDAYLVALARHHRARIVTFDRGLAALHGDVVELLTT